MQPTYIEDKKKICQRIKSKESLVFRSLIVAALLFFLILSVAGYFLFNNQKHKITNHYETIHKDIAKITANSIGLALWNFDNKQAESQLAALKTSEGFCGARILDKNLQTFTELNWENQSNHTYHIENHIEKTPILFKNPNNNQNNKNLKGNVIGSLETCHAHTPMLKEISQQKEILIYAIATMIIILLAICGTALYIITKPLSKLRDAMSKVNLGLKKITDPSLLHDNEIGQLGNSFNKMIEDLIKAQRSLEEKAEEMQLESSKNKLLSSIVISANEASYEKDVIIASEAIQYALHKCCEFWGWSAGHCYLIDPDDGLLKSSQIWSTKNHIKYAKLIRYCNDISIKNGYGMLGNVIENKKSSWIENIEELSSELVRREVIRNAELRSVFAFPIIMGNNACGILEFYSQHKMLKNDNIIKFMEDVGRQLGVAIERGYFQKHLNEAKQQAEKASATKSLFLSNMSHELRTPMHAILNYSQMSLKQLESNNFERMPKYLSNIQTAGNRLLNMLNDLLDLSKLESGKMEIELHNLPFEKPAEYALNELDSLLKQKNLQATITIKAENTIIAIDQDRMVQVMVNLLSNAIKYSLDLGQITIEIENSEYMGKPSLVLSVINHGKNIVEEDLEKIFDVFVQSEGSRNVGGTGLGLAICREIINAHKGKIWAENLTNGVALRINIPR